MKIVDINDKSKNDKREDILGLKVKTKPFGEIIVDENHIFTFPEGILGFDYIRKFVLLEEENSPFLWLQAIEEPDLAFVVIQPITFMQEYQLMISSSDMEAIGAEKPEELLVYAIVTIPVDRPADMTANLQGPIILNPEKLLGRQAISLSEKYCVKHPIVKEMRKEKKEA